MTDTGASTPRKIPTAANTLAVGTVGLELQEGRHIPRKQVISWALWDWATQPFNTVILTFIFTALYLTKSFFLPADVAALPESDPRFQAGIANLAAQLGYAGGVAGLLIAVLAPVLGQRSDTSGKRKLLLAFNTGAVVLSMALLYFVEASPNFFLLGISLVAIGSIFNEIAGVHYNAMLVQVSSPKTVGRVSALGWGLGYIGGILMLVIVVVAQSFDWFGLSTDNGLPFRVIALGCALWTIIFVIPIFLFVPDLPPTAARDRVSFFASYGRLLRDVKALYRDSRPTFWFLLASAVYRDGLAGVFTYGAVLAAAGFGFEFTEVVLFGIAANIIAGVSTFVAGLFDDKIGPRAVIIASLVGLIIAGVAVFALHDLGKIVFWIGGLALTVFVGPAQSASRSLLARVTPAGREGEIFGLYATTGRAASPFSPLLWGLFISIFGAIHFGVLGIVLVLAVGLVLMLLVKISPKSPAAPPLTTESR